MFCPFYIYYFLRLFLELQLLFVHLETVTNAESPKSEHIAGDWHLRVANAVITNSSPGVVVLDLKTSGIR